jgi:hypothetical protein
MSSLFSVKNTEFCEREIEAAGEYIERVFKAPLNLARLHTQLEAIIEEKVSDYYYQRFKDWSVADLLQLAQTVGARVDKENKGKRSGKSKVDQNGQELNNDRSLPA